MEGESFRLMTRGGEFWKYHYRQTGQPSRVVVRLLGTGKEQVLAWKDVGDREYAASIAVCDITEVRKGTGSRTFAENQQYVGNGGLCFSIYTRGRTLDLEAIHPEDYKLWIAGLKRLIETNPRGAGQNDPTNYTYINSRTKEEWVYDGSRMVQYREKTYDPNRDNREVVEDLERHLESSCHADVLDAIEEWLAQKRMTSRAMGPPPEPLDVDQWFKAGPYRNEIGSAAACRGQEPAPCAAAFPTPAGAPPAIEMAPQQQMMFPPPAALQPPMPPSHAGYPSQPPPSQPMPGARYY
eukprot:TRINITY_DN8699_c0_g3_i1.p2 TRINITY_DN8699_c0_g3~~TRINITY_DN8699_c0_g3_i1.p2  ORF type:complete len:295 (+),score=96.93 TRINITY_DN8699_c0_g3_i1:51-935(+)